MPVVFRNTGWRSWFALAAIGLALAAGAAGGQGAAAPPPWNDLLKNELVVVGRYQSHKNGVMSLQVVDVLRGKTCKPGDVLPVKLSQRIALKFVDHEKWFKDGVFYSPPKLYSIEEQDRQVHETLITYNAKYPHTYFFAKEGQVVLDRPEQVQPDRRRGWKQVLEGKPVDLSFRLLYHPVAEAALTRKAVAELFKTRDREALGGLAEALLEPPLLYNCNPTRLFAKRVLVQLGDKGGDVYDPVMKALRTNVPEGPTLAWILASLDSKRAVADFRKLLLEPRPVISRGWLCTALVALESEEGLDLMLEWMQAGEDYAYGSFMTMMFDGDGWGLGTQMVQRARLQELALLRLQKLLKKGALAQPRFAGNFASFDSNFRFLAEDPPLEQQNYIVIRGFFDAANRCPRRDGLPIWEHVDWAARDDLEPVLKADLVEGRKLLKARLARAPKPGPDGPPYDLLILQDLAHRYGDADTARKFKKPADPIVRYYDAKTKNRGVPFSHFKPAFEDTLKLSADYHARLLALFPEHADAYFRELEALLVAEDRPQREFAIKQLQDMFFWHFDFDAEDFPIVSRRKLETLKPLLARLGRSSDLLEMRGIVLQHFGVKLGGPAGRGWLPAVEAAALRWNSVIRLNALCMLGMLEEDPAVMGFMFRPAGVRGKELQGHLKQRRAKRSDKPALTPDELQALWKALDNAKQATSYAAMKSLLEGRESTVSWLGKQLKRAARDPVRDVRAVQVLEYMPGREARTLLEELAAGPEAQPLTHEARGCLERLARFWRW